MSRLVIAAVGDLFFASKIRGAGEQAGAEVVFVKDAEGLFRKVETDAPALVILDLQADKLDAVEAARRLKSSEATRGVRVVGFLSHVEVELQSRAKEAGFDQVLPRSVFSQRLTEIMRGEF
jgi:CheY-like chemotaxis protein